MSTRAEILAEIAAQFPDNTTGLITPAKLRQVVEDVTNSCLVSDTDASTSGKAVLTGTAAQGRQALGFGGTVTVAQLNALAATERDKPYYCSDCLTVNGPGSVVMWCSRTSTWRTMDDCLLATTDFAAWVNDFIQNSNSSEVRGIKGALWCALDTSSYLHLFSTTGGAFTVPPTTTSDPLRRSLSSGGSSATGFTREYTSMFGLTMYSSSMKVFAGIRGNSLSSIASGFTARLGITAYNTIAGALAVEEDSLCYDVGNVLGALNPSGLAQWLACYRTSSVNRAGSGPLGVSPVAGTAANLSVVKQGTAVTMYQNGVLISSGTGGTARPTPFFIIANDGSNLANVTALQLGFCSGYLLP